MNTGQAGRRGDGVRSDCWVEFIPTDSGGLIIQLTSRVAILYGDSIRKLCRDVLLTLGITNCRLIVEDFGALPFTVAARVECAVKRAGLGDGQFLPPMKEHSRVQFEPERMRRSRLYLPGNEPKFFINAGLHKPDGVILDLEDAVAPAEKDAARILVRNALREVNFYEAERMVRINQGDRGLVDIAAIVPQNVHIILIPKAETPQQIKAVDEKIDAVISALSDSRTSITRPRLMPIIESALGGINAYAIATSSPYVIALAIGLEDYTADIGAERTKDGSESLWLRGAVVNAARAAGVIPIDTVFSDVADEEGLRASVLEARRLGFEGKGCIHPRQIRPIHEEFAPSPAEIDRALRIVKAYEDAQRKGSGVVALGTKMIDAPVVKRAIRVVSSARSLGLA